MIDKQVKHTLTDKHILCFGQSPTLFIQTPLRIEWFGAYSSLHGSNRFTSAVDAYMFASVSRNDQRVLRIVSTQYPAINIPIESNLFDIEKGSAQDLIYQLIIRLNQKQISLSHGVNVYIESGHRHGFHFGSSSGFLLLVLEAILNLHHANSNLSKEEKLNIIHSAEQHETKSPIHMHDSLAMIFGGHIFFDLDRQVSPIYQRVLGTFKDYKIVSLSLQNFIYQPHLSIKNVLEQMNIIAQHYQQKRLMDVDSLIFDHEVKSLSLLYGTKAVAKAKHFFQELHVSKQAFLALEKQDETMFYNLLKQSQKRDLELLEHHLVSSPSEQKISNTIKWLNTHFPDVAFRLHGFGFQADFLLVIPHHLYRDLITILKKQFYRDQVRELKIVNQGIRIFKT